ncbi:ABC-2 type transport system ATP-binding protein [Anaerovirgula multivorans]|uniref:ABC-2 type transport system ATP-binding protein n=1 Tax=Anaerovirgula multivorans TaxID=312168 RepID=A0A239DEP1_9FIRM|nr:ABC transporter ATP-binding protein [Anaerovirgula multivorans]SNS30875.1 ABC-2 type transport system ATP-binding protein [Anaerovirgula multivorans]
MEAISINNLSKVYKSGKKALDGLSLTVKESEIFSLLGPNGAGKSTLINILTTYLQPTAGKVSIMGKDVCTEQKSICCLIACVAQKESIDNHLSLKENMLFQSRLYKLDTATANKRMDALIAAFGLKEYEKHRIAAYSGGIKRRLDIAMSMMSFPKILFLDEPTVGMDIESRKAMWDIVKKIKDDFGTTIFLTTHYLEEADMLSDTVCIMQDGHQLVQDTPENLRQHTHQNTIRIDLDSSENQRDFGNWISDLQFVRGIRQEQNTVYANIQNAAQDFHILNQLMMDKQIRYSSIGIVTPSLDDVFLSLTQSKGRSV